MSSWSLNHCRLRCSDDAIFRGQVWNSASSELFMFGKSSLLAELRFAPDYRRGNLPFCCLKWWIRLGVWEAAAFYVRLLCMIRLVWVKQSQPLNGLMFGSHQKISLFFVYDMFMLNVPTENVCAILIYFRLQVSYWYIIAAIKMY